VPATVLHVLSRPASPVSNVPIRILFPMQSSVAFASAAPLALRQQQPLLSAPGRLSSGLTVSTSASGRLRMAVASEMTNRYVGTPPVERRGRLRINAQRPYAIDETIPPEREGPSTDADKFKWSRGGYTKLGRATAIWGFIARLLASNYIDGKRWSYSLGDRSEKNIVARRRALAAWAREEILRIGPTMIKVGQLASARADILPAEVCASRTGREQRRMMQIF
jgi:hypothetical protein